MVNTVLGFNHTRDVSYTGIRQNFEMLHIRGIPQKLIRGMAKYASQNEVLSYPILLMETFACFWKCVKTTLASVDDP